MHKAKQITNNVCGFLQIFYGFAIIVLSLLLLAKWLFNDDTLFLPTVLEKISNLFDNQNVAKILTPSLGIVVGTIDIVLALLLLKSTAQKPLGVVAFFSAVINLATAVIFCWWFTADTAKGVAIFFAILTGIIAVTEFVSAVKVTTPHTDTSPQIQPQAQAQTPIQTTYLPPTPNATQHSTTTTEEKTLQDFKQRSAELFRLAKNNSISQENLDYCLSWLMSMPLDQPFSLKINHLNKFTSSGMLTRPVISKLICKAVVCHNTSSFKKRIYFLEQMQAQNAITEEDYSDAVRKLMADGNTPPHDL